MVRLISVLFIILLIIELQTTDIKIYLFLDFEKLIQPLDNPKINIQKITL